MCYIFVGQASYYIARQNRSNEVITLFMLLCVNSSLVFRC